MLAWGSELRPMRLIIIFARALASASSLSDYLWS